VDETVNQVADPQRAIDALEQAAARAERAAGELLKGGVGGPMPPIVNASRDDYRAAAQVWLPDVRARLDRVLMSADAEAGLDALLEAGALAAILPEVEAMVGFGDGEWRHKDVWKHTKQVVRQAVPRLEVRWAALLHDIGKVKTRSISPEGEVHFFGHAEVGARMFDRIDRRVPLFTHDDAFKTSVRFLILHHLRASQYDASWTDSAVRRFAKEIGDQLEDLLCLSRADITTKRPEKKRKGLKQISDLADRVRLLAAEDAVVPPLPGGIGDEMMKAFGLPPSRKIGDLKRALEACIEQGEIPSHQPADVYIVFLRENASRFGL
jgi:poly(A) polymerase